MQRVTHGQTMPEGGVCSVTWSEDYRILHRVVASAKRLTFICTSIHSVRRQPPSRQSVHCNENATGPQAAYFYPTIRPPRQISRFSSRTTKLLSVPLAMPPNQGRTSLSVPLAMIPDSGRLCLITSLPMLPGGGRTFFGIPHPLQGSA